ncbi:MAG: hypothetical protein ACTTIM_02025 [Campylobacter sp.]
MDLKLNYAQNLSQTTKTNPQVIINLIKKAKFLILHSNSATDLPRTHIRQQLRAI